MVFRFLNRTTGSPADPDSAAPPEMKNTKPARQVAEEMQKR